jgi:hypothetical protein
MGFVKKCKKRVKSTTKSIKKGIKRTVTEIGKAGHNVEKHAIRPAFKPINRVIKSLEKRGFAFNGQIGTNGQDIDYNASVEHKYWSIVLQDGDIGINAHPKFKNMENVNFDIGIGNDGFHGDIEVDVKNIGQFGMGIDDNGYFLDARNNEGIIRLDHGEIIVIGNEFSNGSQYSQQLQPILMIPPNVDNNLEHGLTNVQVKRYLIFWTDLWNASINAYPMNPIDWGRKHWNESGINESRRECFDLTEVQLSEKIKNYALKQILINDFKAWEATIKSGLHPYQMSSPVDANSMDDRQAKRYLIYWNDLLDAAPSHGRIFNEDQISWAKRHWKNNGIHEPRSECFSDLEPTLAFNVKDYHLKRTLVDDLELWYAAFDSDQTLVEYIKNNVKSGLEAV